MTRSWSRFAVWIACLLSPLLLLLGGCAPMTFGSRPGPDAIGMDQAAVLARYGSPRHVNRTTTAHGVREQWVYGYPGSVHPYPRHKGSTPPPPIVFASTYQFIYLENGRVVAVQD